MKRVSFGGIMIKRGILFGIALIIGILPVSSVSAFTGTGIGTVGDPYRVRTCAQIFEINADLDAHYVLTNDIDCTGATWQHIGTISSSAFSGTLDGDGYTISNLTVDDTNGVGLFTFIDGGTITNLYLDNFDITGTGTVGALAARADNATISRVHVTDSTVRSEYATGGMVGILNTSTVSDSSVAGTTVTARSGPGFAEQIGGFVGISTGNTYNRSSSGGTVDPTLVSAISIEDTGGFIAYASGDIVNDSYSTATVKGDMNVGGFVGNHASSVFDRSYASGDVFGNSRVGGFSGMSALSMLRDSFATGAISANTMSGGLIGRVQAIGGDVDNSTWDVTRTGQGTCVGADQGITYSTVCLAGVNVSSAEPNYFFNSTTNAPLDEWNFSSVWRTTSGLPVLQTTPLRVDNVRVTPASNSLLIRWEVPADTGGSAVTSYDLKYRPSSSQTYTVVPSIAVSSAPEYTITGLTPNTEYTVEVRARNAVGQGLWLGFIVYTTPATIVPASSTTTKLASSYFATTSTTSTEDTTTESTADDEDVPETPRTSTPEDTSDTADDSAMSPVTIAVIVIVILGVGAIVIRLVVRK